MGDVTPISPNVVMEQVIINDLNIKEIRVSLGMDVKTFASTFRFKYGVVLDWERGRVQPMGSERVLLYLIKQMPSICLKVAQEMPLPVPNEMLYRD